MKMREGVETKHISWFVWGAMADWAHTHRVNLDMEYVYATMGIVLSYVNGERRTLDGSLSDLQCVIATDAKNLFGKENSQRTAKQAIQQRKEFWLDRPDTEEAQAKIRELEVLTLVLSQMESRPL